MKFTLTIISFLLSLTCISQTGEIKGRIVSEDSLAVPLAKIWVERGDSVVYMKRADMDGNFSLRGLEPGVYVLKSVAVGMDTSVMINIPVTSNTVRNVEKFILNHRTVVDYPCYPPVYVDPFWRTHLSEWNYRTIPQEDLNIFYKNLPLQVLDDYSTIKSSPTAHFNPVVRGSRPNDITTFYGGVRIRDSLAIPRASISDVKIYESGIPAKYGDTTGGVVVFETQGYFDLYYEWIWKNGIPNVFW